METDLTTTVETGTSRFEEPTKVLFSNEEKQEKKNTHISMKYSQTRSTDMEYKLQ